MNRPNFLIRVFRFSIVVYLFSLRAMATDEHFGPIHANEDTYAMCIQWRGINYSAVRINKGV